MTPQEQALQIATAVTRVFEEFGDGTEAFRSASAPPSIETMRILTTGAVYRAALQVFDPPEPRAEA